MKSGYWNLGWSDQVANLKASLNCVSLIDTQGNGQYNLVVADQTQRLVSYKNTNIAWETRLAEKPICITSLYNDNSGQPCICIGCGNNIYCYKAFKSFFRYPIPIITFKQQEIDCWKAYSNDQNLKSFVSKLQKLQRDGVNLSYKSLEILCYCDETKQVDLIDKYSDNLNIEDSITCMEVLKKNPDDEKSQGVLIIGTELKYIYMYNSEVTAIQKKFELGGTPISIAVFSEDQKDGRIAVLVRENCIYFIGNEVEDYTIDLSSKPISMIRQIRCLFIATMDRVVQNYNHKQKQFQIQLSQNIIALEAVTTGKGMETKGLLIGLDNKTIQFYKDTQLMSVINVENNVSVMKFGFFGQSQDGFLITIHNNGALETRSLSREFEKKKQAIIEPEVIKPIEFPPTTNLFLEQFQREKDQGQEMLRTYQFDLLRMRHKTAQTYLNILSNEQLAPQLSQNNKLRITANVEGLGPKFKLICIVENISQVPIKDVSINYVYNSEIFSPYQLTNRLSYLIPQHQRQFESYFINNHQNGISDIIKIILYQGSKQLVSASIKMPMSELE